MARDYARIKVAIWNDPDWRNLSLPAQGLYHAAANPFEAHSADECPHSDLDDLDEFGTPPLPIEAPDALHRMRSPDRLPRR